MTKVWKHDLPSYPKAFVAKANLGRERGRVFMVMPFEEPHSEDLWEVTESATKILKVKLLRADRLLGCNPILPEILEELERAEVIIADLTGGNPNVFYELGIAHVRCDRVILLCRKGQKLPFNLAQMRCIFFDDLKKAEARNRLAKELTASLQGVRERDPIVITSKLERTQKIVDDLKRTLQQSDEDLKSERILYSGFLSAFAISSQEEFSSEDEKVALLEERDSLLELARRGCRLKCIISPPNDKNVILAGPNIRHGLIRLSTLLDFLESGDAALENIHWAVSPFRQKNQYIIGKTTAYEGFKSGTEKGYSLTLFESGFDVVDAAVGAFDKLFDTLSVETMRAYGRRGRATLENLRNATIACSKEAQHFLESVAQKKHLLHQELFGSDVESGVAAKTPRRMLATFGKMPDLSVDRDWGLGKDAPRERLP